ncbi:MAG: sigma-70 family RNA polymerase sigma factor [Streptosporangiaceae bacterium]
MRQDSWLAARFEESRPHLRGVAYRLLGSREEADDALQESWIKLSQSDADKVENLTGWLTTVVARVCLDMLRSRRARPEDPAGTQVPESLTDPGEPGLPEQQALIADSIGSAMLVVLDMLSPPERVAFVLHDIFGVSFEEIAPIIGKTTAASRQLASRARRRVQGTGQAPSASTSRQRVVVDAFLAASREGNFGVLLALLDPEVVLRSDASAIAAGRPARVSGAHDIAQMFSGRARGAKLALIDGEAGLVWAPRGQPRVVFALQIDGDLITRIDLIADVGHLAGLELVILD